MNMVETTLAIIKPDAIGNLQSGQIINLIELNGFVIAAMHKIMLSREEAEGFYDVHRKRPFFNELVEYMISGPVIVMALTKENAVKEWRDLMGATNPEQAGPGTIRRMFGESIANNAVHGSDSLENAEKEIAFFFEEGACDDEDECE